MFTGKIPLQVPGLLIEEEKNKGEKQGHSWRRNIWEGYAFVGVDGVGCVCGTGCEDRGAVSTCVPPPTPWDAEWPWGSHAMGIAVRQEVPSSPCETLARLIPIL